MTTPDITPTEMHAIRVAALEVAAELAAATMPHIGDVTTTGAIGDLTVEYAKQFAKFIQQG